MKLTEEAIEAINNPNARMKIAIALGVIETSVRNYIRDNDDNGNLTKAAALDVIEQVTGLTQSEILTEEKVVSK